MPYQRHGRFSVAALVTVTLLGVLTSCSIGSEAALTPVSPVATVTPTVINCVSVPSSCGYPDATNTGVPEGTVLTKSGSLVVTKAGTVLDGLDISGTVYINANNVTIKRCRIRASAFAIVWIPEGVTGTVIQDSEIDGLGTGEGSNAINGMGTFVRNNIHGVENGWNGLTSAQPSVFRDSYIWGLLAPGGPHYDGIQLDGGISDVTFDHNTVINKHGQTSAVMIDNYFGPISNVTVRNNLLAGGGYTVYSDAQFSGTDKITGVSFTGNRLVKGQYGYAAFNSNNPTWTGNFSDATGMQVSS